MFELLDSCGQSAVIKVIGIGGGGGNAVQHMVEAEIETEQRRRERERDLALIDAGRTALREALEALIDRACGQGWLQAGDVVVVVGSEGKGLSRLVRETCDVVVSIPMAGPAAGRPCMVSSC